MPVSIVRVKNFRVEEDFPPLSQERVAQLEKRAKEAIENMKHKKYVIGADGAERLVVR